MKGKLIVLEGTDASGKSTQFARLCQYCDDRQIEYRRLVFPRYHEESSALIRMYLGGEFGSHPDDVSAYAASTFFAVDRFASYRKEWKDYYENGGLILADRYTTSNAIHQASKLEGTEQKAFLEWLFDFEYRIMGLPAPDHVFFLDMPTEAVHELLIHREGKEIDIHEKDIPYLKRCYDTASALAERFGWERIRCTENGAIRPIEEISADLTNGVSALLRK
ncbi:MAG: thymidylate kinase [Eubacteriales bacterium]|nr:thymidylate kinase [Eubacteriales bacterium]